MGVVRLARQRFATLDRVLSAFYVRIGLRLLFRAYTLVVFGYCLVPFILLSHSKWWDVLAQFYFLPHLFYLSYNLLVSPFLLPPIERWLRHSTPPAAKEPASSPVIPDAREKGKRE